VGQIPRVNSSGGLTLPNTRLLITGTAGAAPATPPAGQFTLYLDASDKLAKIDENDTVTVIEQAAGMTNPMTTAGDMIVGGASGVPGRTAVGTEGQVWSVVSGAPAWAAATAGADNQTIVEYHDDFHAAGAALSDGVMGALGWQRTVASGATQGSQYIDSTVTDHPGILELFQASSISADHGTCAYLGSTVSTISLMYDSWDSGTSRPWHEYFVFKLESVEDSAFYAGFLNTCTLTAGDHPFTSAVAVRYDTGLTTPDSGTGKFRLMACSGGTCAVTPSSISADTNWHSAHIYSTADGVISLSVDGETAVTVSTQVPGAVAMSPMMGAWTRTTTSKPVQYDYFKFKQTLVR